MKHEAGRKGRKFSAEYKAEVVKLINGSDKSIAVLSRELGIGETALRRWVEQCAIDGGGGGTGALTRGEREELTQLRRDVKRLLMEREILKKATAFFAKQNG